MISHSVSRPFTTSTARTPTGATTPATVGYGYDTAGQLTALAYPGGAKTTRAYDTAGRLTGVTDGAARTATFTWDAGGNLKSAAYPNGVVTTNTYTAAEQLTGTMESAITT